MWCTTAVKDSCEQGHVPLKDFGNDQSSYRRRVLCYGESQPDPQVAHRTLDNHTPLVILPQPFYNIQNILELRGIGCLSSGTLHPRVWKGQAAPTPKEILYFYELKLLPMRVHPTKVGFYRLLKYKRTHYPTSTSSHCLDLREYWFFTTCFPLKRVRCLSLDFKIPDTLESKMLRNLMSAIEKVNGMDDGKGRQKKSRAKKAKAFGSSKTSDAQGISHTLDPSAVQPKEMEPMILSNDEGSREGLVFPKAVASLKLSSTDPHLGRKDKRDRHLSPRGIRDLQASVSVRMAVLAERTCKEVSYMTVQLDLSLAIQWALEAQIEYIKKEALEKIDKNIQEVKKYCTEVDAKADKKYLQNFNDYKDDFENQIEDKFKGQHAKLESANSTMAQELKEAKGAKETLENQMFVQALKEIVTLCKELMDEKEERKKDQESHHRALVPLVDLAHVLVLTCLLESVPNIFSYLGEDVEEFSNMVSIYKIDINKYLNTYDRAKDEASEDGEAKNETKDVEGDKAGGDQSAEVMEVSSKEGDHLQKDNPEGKIQNQNLMSNVPPQQ
uniref:Uncharacterized protein n=1 Tax=Cannabis sativa TaxID=3483 RepID=A0A803PLL4_CANSA